MEELHGSVCPLFEDALATDAQDVGDFDLEAVTVELIEALKHQIPGIDDSPYADDRVAVVRFVRQHC